MPSIKDTFEAQYQVEDGYVTGARPQRFQICAEEIEDDMTDEALEDFYASEVTRNFNDSEKIYPVPEKVNQFVTWAKAQIAKRKAAEFDEAREHGLIGPE